jgi:coenzyme F420-reducing hydrogenase delta subunit
MILPAVIVFVCNWDGYLGLEEGVHSGLTLPAEVKIIKVSCLSRVPAGLILKAFEMGAAGVLLAGCAEHNCHYNNDRTIVEGQIEKVRGVMALMGLAEKQLELLRVSRDEGKTLINKIREFANGCGN